MDLRPKTRASIVNITENVSALQTHRHTHMHHHTEKCIHIQHAAAHLYIVNTTAVRG